MNTEVVTSRKGHASMNSFVSYFNFYFFLTSNSGCRLFTSCYCLEYDLIFSASVYLPFSIYFSSQKEIIAFVELCN